ncbi:hypothetical protein D1872_50570 [compost metagenome]
MPTDERFLNLTTEQLSLMAEHYALDQRKHISPEAANDPDYEEPESYHDPDFDAEWETGLESEKSGRDSLSENPPHEVSEPFGEDFEILENLPSNASNGEWEEV